MNIVDLRRNAKVVYKTLEPGQTFQWSPKDEPQQSVYMVTSKGLAYVCLSTGVHYPFTSWGERMVTVVKAKVVVED